jgi:hypothetical protein
LQVRWPVRVSGVPAWEQMREPSRTIWVSRAGTLITMTPPAIGFAGVMSGPLVRSSYRAGRLYREAIGRRRQPRRGPDPEAGVPG